MMCKFLEKYRVLAEQFPDTSQGRDWFVQGELLCLSVTIADFALFEGPSTSRISTVPERVLTENEPREASTAAHRLLEADKSKGKGKGKASESGTERDDGGEDMVIDDDVALPGDDGDLPGPSRPSPPGGSREPSPVPSPRSTSLVPPAPKALSRPPSPVPSYLGPLSRSPSVVPPAAKASSRPPSPVRSSPGLPARSSSPLTPTPTTPLADGGASREPGTGPALDKGGRSLRDRGKGKQAILDEGPTPRPKPRPKPKKPKTEKKTKARVDPASGVYIDLTGDVCTYFFLLIILYSPGSIRNWETRSFWTWTSSRRVSFT
jgi:hypothetical protein